MARRGHWMPGTVMAASIAGLGALNWTALTEQIDTSPVLPSTAAAAGQSGSAIPVDAAKHPALSDLSETLARPLFSATRRPIFADTGDTVNLAATATTAPQTPTSSTITPNPGLRLIGIMQGDESRRSVLIHASDAPRANWVKVGAEIGGWRLTSIASDSVVVESSGTRSVLKLYPATTSAGATE